MKIEITEGMYHVILGMALAMLGGSILVALAKKPKDTVGGYDRLLEDAKYRWELEHRLEELTQDLKETKDAKHSHLPGYGGMPQ